MVTDALRIGNGYDIHRLVDGGPLILGGVRIEYERGLHGHSDGDVLTHAIINALLGAAALGDIGMHFPPGDPKFKGINSLDMLKTVHDLIQQHGYQIGNIDSMVICERPKLSPHYPAMRKALSDALSIDMNNISVKASTAEGLGTIGSGEAIAAHAVAILIS
jgi:2-C-methyl-D-erythritol 2,4-cyclodiphosphate synthase